MAGGKRRLSESDNVAEKTPTTKKIKTATGTQIVKQDREKDRVRSKNAGIYDSGEPKDDDDFEPAWKYKLISFEHQESPENCGRSENADPDDDYGRNDHNVDRELAWKRGFVSLTYQESPENVYVYSGRRDPTIGNDPNCRDERNLYWSQKMQYFIASDSCLNDEVGWVGLRPIGFGGQALVGLWTRKVEVEVGKQKMSEIEFMAIKEIRQVQWDEDEELSEARILRELSNLHCNNIIKFKRYLRFPREEKHRIYLEFAPHYNLKVLIGRYKRWQRYFPEPWLWYLFYCLAKALFTMHHSICPDKRPTSCTFTSTVKRLPGLTDGLRPQSSSVAEEARSFEKNISTVKTANDENRDYDSIYDKDLQALCKERGLQAIGRKALLIKRLIEDDDQNAVKAKAQVATQSGEHTSGVQSQSEDGIIVHRDIKPANVFLGEPDECTIYPSPKLGDYGHALRLPAEGIEGPDVSMGYDAPEHHSAKSDIYMLGVTMSEATTLCFPSHSRDEELKIDEIVLPYRRPLLNLIRRCASVDQAQRPTAEELYSITKRSWEACLRRVEHDPDRFAIYYEKETINAMATGFYKPSMLDGDFCDLQYPDNIDDGVGQQSYLVPPRFKNRSDDNENLEFFEEPNPRFGKGDKWKNPGYEDEINLVADKYNYLLEGGLYDEERVTEEFEELMNEESDEEEDEDEEDEGDEVEEENEEGEGEGGG